MLRAIPKAQAHSFRRSGDIDSHSLSPGLLLELAIAITALALALLTRPWRMLAGTARSAEGKSTCAAGSALATPLLAVLVLLPWMWALPGLQRMPMSLHWSASPLVVLMLGWPLAVPALLLVAGLAWAWSLLITPALAAPAVLSLAVWTGIVPATLAMLWGAGVRRLLPQQIFVFILVRSFLGTVLSVFVSLQLGSLIEPATFAGRGQQSWLAALLLAWSDGVVTGMLTAVFVAFRPQWMATWSDAIYLRPHE